MMWLELVILLMKVFLPLAFLVASIGCLLLGYNIAGGILLGVLLVFLYFNNFRNPPQDGEFHGHTD